MIKAKIGEMFDFISETNLTEEFFYEHKGNYPVFSGQTENEGIVAFIDTFYQEGPCITFTTYGSAGKMYFRNGKYTIGRNCMGLKLKEEYKDKVNMEYFSFKFQNLFYRLRIGDPKGQKSLNKTLIENVEVIILSKNIQEKQLKLYKKAKILLETVNDCILNFKKMLNISIVVSKYKYEESLSEIFHFEGGNGGLTEEFIYYNQPTSEDDKMAILSGATLKANLMGYISRNAKPNSKGLKVFKGPAIIVVRKGIAGQMTLISDGEFTTNDDVYVLIPKKDWKDKINLRWFAYQYQELFFNLVTSKSDNATFNKEYARKQMVKIPDITVQNKIAEKFLIVEELVEKLEKLKREIEELIEYEII